jgi:hypothetical protein
LNNLVQILKPGEPRAIPAFPERVARLAFEKANTWDVMVTAWLKPAPAWIALMVFAILSAAIWLSPLTAKKNDAYSQYEMISNDAVTTATSNQIQTEDLSTWFQMGGQR